MPAFIAAILTLGVGAATRFLKNYMLVAATALLLPALYGAMAFGADQRRRRYLFLAEHAAWPRYIWLTRHLLWGGTLFVIVMFVLGFEFSVLSTHYYDNVRQFVNYESWRDVDQYEIAVRLLPPVDLVALAASAVACGSLLAYAVGQFFSMLLRSEILAAFAACIASVLICAWCVLMTVWGLSSLWFVSPLAVGFLGATWLRAPDWIVERNSWQHWLRPAAAILIPFVIVVASVPSVRLAQVPRAELSRAEAIIAPVRDRFKVGDTAAARETAAMYLRAADLLDSWQTHDPLAKWSQYEVLGLDKLYGVDAGKILPNGIDASKIPPAQSVAFEAAVREHWKLKDEAQAAALKEFLAASARQTCRFDFDLSYAPLRTSYPSTEELERNRARLDPQYQRLNKLTIRLANFGQAGDQALEDYLAALRATAHLRSGQPSLIFCDQLSFEAGALDHIVAWARKGSTTDEEIRLAIKQLLRFFNSLPDPAEAIWADHLLVADVLAGKQPPLLFAYPPISWQFHLAYLLHQLPWERSRAQSVLELLTADDLRRVNGLTRFLREGPIRDRPYRRDTDWPYTYYELRNWVQSIASGRGGAAMPNRIAAMIFSFSFVRAEYDARTHAQDLELQLVDTEMRRRATLLQLALELYRRDRGEYPNDLQELAPQYLEKVPIDPYSGTPFNYLPNGTDLPVVNALANGHDIAAGTPFFWSVGPHNFTKLARMAGWDEVRDSAAPDVVTGYSQLKDVYRFWKDDWTWPRETYVGVFPLPK